MNYIEPLISYKVARSFSIKKFFSRTYVNRKLKYKIDQIYRGRIEFFSSYYNLTREIAECCYNSIKSLTYEYLRSQLKLLSHDNVIEKTKDFLNFEFNEIEDGYHITCKLSMCNNETIPNTIQDFNMVLYLCKTRDNNSHKLFYSEGKPIRIKEILIEIRKKEKFKRKIRCKI